MLKEANNNTVYLYIINGKLTQKVTEGADGAVQRTNKKGTVVYEKHFSSVAGYIKDLKIEGSDFGDNLIVHMIDGGENCQIQISVESRYFTSFVAKIGNVDTSQGVEIKTFSFQPEDKKVSGVNFYQSGGKVDYFINKDNQPEGYPPFPEDWQSLADAKKKVYWIEKTEWEKEYIQALPISPAEPSKSEDIKGKLDGLMDQVKEEMGKETPF